MIFTNMCTGTSVGQGHARKRQKLQETRKRIRGAGTVVHARWQYGR